MRMIFSLIGLLIVVAIIGVVAKKQLSAVATVPAATSTTATPANMRVGRDSCNLTQEWA